MIWWWWGPRSLLFNIQFRHFPHFLRFHLITIKGEGRCGDFGLWIFAFLKLTSWILQKKSIGFLIFKKSFWFWFLLILSWILNIEKMYHWILDFWMKIRRILGFVRCVEFLLDLDYSKSYHWILDFGQKKFVFLDSRTPRSPPPYMLVSTFHAFSLGLLEKNIRNVIFVWIMSCEKFVI